MSNLIKRRTRFPDNLALEKELEYILAQLPHKDDVVMKNAISEVIEYDGTGTLKITVTQGQITNIEIEE